jgi:dephospho-CoA kinase
MKIIGITGGIGSGKSTVSGALRDLGAVVVDADVISRNVTAVGTKAYNELIEYFGNDIVRENGELDRKKLADISFNDKVKLHALNCITHKYIAEKIYDTVELIKNSGKSDIIVIDAAIPLEKGFIDLADEIWVVECERDKRVKRIMERSGYTYEEAESRINSQPSDEQYADLADEILYNNESLEALEQAVVKLFLQKKQEWQK